MATGDILKKYAASSAQTVTNLHSLASSQSWVAGWESGAIDNTTNGYDDYRIMLHLVTHASNRQAGTIKIYLIGPIDDSTWPDVFDGTESVETPTDTEEFEGYAKIARVLDVDNSASAAYDIDIPSAAAVFGYNLPKKFVIFVTGNCTTTTTAQFAASGSTVTVTGSYYNVSA
jgi:hypothetical protein